MDSSGSASYVSEECVAFLVGDMFFVGHDDTARNALILEQDQLRGTQATDLDGEAGKNVVAHAVAAVTIFHWNYPPYYFAEAMLPV